MIEFGIWIGDCDKFVIVGVGKANSAHSAFGFHDRERSGAIAFADQIVVVPHEVPAVNSIVFGEPGHHLLDGLIRISEQAHAPIPCEHGGERNGDISYIREVEDVVGGRIR